MNFKTFNRLDESIVDVLAPLIGQQLIHPKPFSLTDMVNALNDAHVTENPSKIKTAIKMLDSLIDYVILLSDGKRSVTVKGIEDFKNKLITALKKIEA